LYLADILPFCKDYSRKKRRADKNPHGVLFEG
jgi:hypothetical protein